MLVREGHKEQEVLKFSWKKLQWYVAEAERQKAEQNRDFVSLLVSAVGGMFGGNEASNNLKKVMEGLSKQSSL